MTQESFVQLTSWHVVLQLRLQVNEKELDELQRVAVETHCAAIKVDCRLQRLSIRKFSDDRTHRGGPCFLLCHFSVVRMVLRNLWRGKMIKIEQCWHKIASLGNFTGFLDAFGFMQLETLLLSVVIFVAWRICSGFLPIGLSLALTASMHGRWTFDFGTVFMLWSSHLKSLIWSALSFMCLSKRRSSVERAAISMKSQNCAGGGKNKLEIEMIYRIHARRRK